nr:substrate-binding domain-containing protein [Motilibacter aurantiacus]
MVVTDWANPFFTDVAQGADHAASERDVTVALCSSFSDRDREHRHLERFEAARASGVIVTPLDVADPWLHGLASRGVPVVVLARQIDDPGLCSVRTDDEAGGALAARHLLERGHRRLAFVGLQFGDRHRGATRVVERPEFAGAGLLAVAAEAPALAAGRQAGDEIAALPPRRRSTGVLCGNDLLALGVLQAMTEHGLRPPEDVAIVGYDDIGYAAGAAVPLTFLRQPSVELGRAAVRLLLDEVDRGPEHRHEHVVFVPELVVRRSSDVTRRVRRASSLTRLKSDRPGQDVFDGPVAGHD